MGNYRNYRFLAKNGFDVTKINALTTPAPCRRFPLGLPLLEPEPLR